MDKTFKQTMACVLIALTVAGCSSLGNADPYLRDGIRMDIVGINYVTRNVGEFWVDGNWGANLGAARVPGEKMGGNASLCCFNLTDYRKPVKVKWVWSRINSDPIMGPDGMFLPQKLLAPDIEKEKLVTLPRRAPIIVKSKNYQDKFKSEDTLCVIFRDMDTVELQYSSGDCREY